MMLVKYIYLLAECPFPLLSLGAVENLVPRSLRGALKRLGWSPGQTRELDKSQSRRFRPSGSEEYERKGAREMAWRIWSPESGGVS